MNTVNKTKLMEATIAATAVIGIAAIVLPNVGVIAAGLLTVAALAAIGTLDAKKRAY